jgi:hypothetical protein
MDKVAVWSNGFAEKYPVTFKTLCVLGHGYDTMTYQQFIQYRKEFPLPVINGKERIFNVRKLIRKNGFITWSDLMIEYKPDIKLFFVLRESETAFYWEKIFNTYSESKDYIQNCLVNENKICLIKDNL